MQDLIVLKLPLEETKIQDLELCIKIEEKVVEEQAKVIETTEEEPRMFKTHG